MMMRCDAGLGARRAPSAGAGTGGATWHEDHATYATAQAPEREKESGRGGGSRERPHQAALGRGPTAACGRADRGDTLQRTAARGRKRLARKKDKQTHAGISSER